MAWRNCGLLTRTIVVACAAALGLGLTFAVDDRMAAVAAPSACTAKQKKQRQLAVTSYKKRMPKDRAAYYRKHKSRKLRAAFVKKQQARLKALQKSLAACSKKAPPRTTTTTTTTTTTPPRTTTSTSTTTTASPLADLRVTASASTAGPELRWSFRVANAGPAAASAVATSIQMPAGVTLISSAAGCAGSGPVVCDLGTMASGEERGLTIAVRPPPAAGLVTLTATVMSATADPVQGNNTTAPSLDVAPADVSLETLVSHSERSVGRTITYTLTIRNTGPTNAVGMVVTDPFPAGVELVSLASQKMSCSGVQTITCGRGSLTPGETASATVVVRLTAAGVIANVVSVRSGTPDPNAANESATATTNAMVITLPPATTGPTCAPALTRGPIVSIGHPSTYTEGATDYGIFIRPIGTVRALMLFVDFSDAPASEATTAVYQQTVPETSAWFTDESDGRVSLQVDGHHAWLRMPHSSMSYGISTGSYNEQYVRDAIAKADPTVNFSPYEIVYILASAGAALSGGQSPYAFSGGLFTGERELRHVAVIGPNGRNAETLEHETLHHFGLPDLYDFDPVGGRTRHVGGWDPMSMSVGAILAWHKWKLGWIDAGSIRCLATPGQLEETLTPVTLAGGVKAVVVPTDASRAYVVEAREPVGRDAATCDSGVLVYTVDATVWSGSGPIRVKPAAAAVDPALLGRCGPLYNAPFDVGPGEVSSFHEAGITVEVLLSSPQGYRVRVTRT